MHTRKNGQSHGVRCGALGITYGFLCVRRRAEEKQKDAKQQHTDGGATLHTDKRTYALEAQTGSPYIVYIYAGGTIKNPRLYYTEVRISPRLLSWLFVVMWALLCHYSVVLELLFKVS